MISQPTSPPLFSSRLSCKKIPFPLLKCRGGEGPMTANQRQFRRFSLCLTPKEIREGGLQAEIQDLLNNNSRNLKSKARTMEVQSPKFQVVYLWTVITCLLHQSKLPPLQLNPVFFCPFPFCDEGKGQPKLSPLSSLTAAKTDPSFPDPTLFSHFLLASFSGTGYSTPKSFRGCTGSAPLSYKPAQKRDEEGQRVNSIRGKGGKAV